MTFLLRLAVVAATTAAAAASNPYAAGYPSPWASGGPGWDDAYAKAKEFVSGLTLLEKVNLTSGTGWQADECVGNTGSVPRLGFRGFCMQDGPLGIRFSELYLSWLGEEVMLMSCSGSKLGVSCWRQRRGDF